MLVDRILALASAIAADIKALTASVAGKVDKVSGKGLSTNDYTSAEKSKLAGLATVATSGSYNDLANKPAIPAAQVNSDWNASSGKAQILNRPGAASPAAAGLMSAADKIKLDGLDGDGLPSWSSDTRPAVSDGGLHLGFNTTFGALEYWNGATWMRLQSVKAWRLPFGAAHFGHRL